MRRSLSGDDVASVRGGRTRFAGLLLVLARAPPPGRVRGTDVGQRATRLEERLQRRRTSIGSACECKWLHSRQCPLRWARAKLTSTANCENDRAGNIGEQTKQQITTGTVSGFGCERWPVLAGGLNVKGLQALCKRTGRVGPAIGVTQPGFLMLKAALSGASWHSTVILVPPLHGGGQGFESPAVHQAVYTLVQAFCDSRRVSGRPPKPSGQTGCIHPGRQMAAPSGSRRQSTAVDPSRGGDGTSPSASTCRMRMDLESMRIPSACVRHDRHNITRRRVARRQ